MRTFPKFFVKTTIPLCRAVIMIIMEQKRSESIAKTCPPEACDTFQFMAKEIGLSVLHPGGLDATRKVAELIGIGNGLKIIDLGCGRGSSSIFLARDYGLEPFDLAEGFHGTFL